MVPMSIKICCLDCYSPQMLCKLAIMELKTKHFIASAKKGGLAVDQLHFLSLHTSILSYFCVPLPTPVRNSCTIVPGNEPISLIRCHFTSLNLIRQKLSL